MTVESTTTKARYAGNGQTTLFPVPFCFERDEHVRAVVRHAAPDNARGIEDVPLAQGTDYSLTGAGSGQPGTLVHPLSGEPLPEGATLTVYSEIPITQERAWNNLDAIDTAQIERADDKLTRICLQLGEQLERCVKLPMASPESETPIDPEELLTARSTALAARDGALASEAAAARSAIEASENALNAATAAVNAAALAESAAASDLAATASERQAAAHAATAFGASAPAWDPLTQYAFPDVVAGPDGHTWRAMAPVPGEMPDSGVAWVRLTIDSDGLLAVDSEGDVILAG